MTKRPLAVVILAAGKGTRMKSKTPKVLHEVMGLPMISWLLGSVERLSPERIIVVTGKGMDDLAKAVKPHDTVIQPTQEGTGHAVKCAYGVLKDFKGDILVLLGDTPLISAQTIEQLIETRHEDTVTGITVLGAQVDKPFGYGRLLIGKDGYLEHIREEKDASEDEKRIQLINTGVFCMDSVRLGEWLEHLKNDNAQKEYLITDLPSIAAREGIKTRVCITHNPREVQGCNTRVDLAKLEQYAQARMREYYLNEGIVMQDPDSVYFHYDTKIGEGCKIEPNVYFGPGVEVGQNVHIKAFCHFDGAKIGDHTVIGPFARLRPGTELGQDVRIGNFVEIKKSSIGNRSKINHLGYVGDCTMGDDVNFSCGAITVNYDGFQKHQTIIGKGVMVGSNVNLIAPVTIDDGAFIAAGSTITENVPADALSMTRPETQTKIGWAALYRKKKSTPKAE